MSNLTQEFHAVSLLLKRVRCGIRNAQTGAVLSPEASEFYIEGNEIYNTGVSLITNDPQDGIDSLTAEEGRAICWGNP